MPLPKIATPFYDLELPSTGEKIEYRPFLVKEEKLLVLAMESQDQKQITKAIREVIKSCVRGEIKVESLPTFDIEYLFLNIRGKSVGEEIELKVIAPDDGDADIFVHISQVQQSGLNELQDNQKVSFDVEEGRNGKNQATNLKLA